MALTSERGYRQHPQWSPDSQWIAYSNMVWQTLENPPPDAKRTEPFSQICAVSAQGGREKLLTAGLKDCFHPSWSPDGQWIVYDETDRGFMHRCGYTVYDAEMVVPTKIRRIHGPK